MIVIRGIVVMTFVIITNVIMTTVGFLSIYIDLEMHCRGEIPLYFTDVIVIKHNHILGH